MQYGRGALPRSFLPTYYVPVDDVLPAALVDPVQAETALTVWAVAAAGLRADDAAWMHHRPPQRLEALAGLVTFSWLDPLTWFEEEEPLLAHARDPGRRGGKLEGRPGRDRRRAAGRAAAAVALDAGDAALAAERALASADTADTAGAPIEAALSRTIAGQALAEAGEKDRAVAELQRA